MDTLTAALTFARDGVPVFPVFDNDKRPAVDKWREQATDDANTVGEWFTDTRRNIGRPTGKNDRGTGVDVLDFDDDGSGKCWEVYRELKHSGLLVGAQALVHTPSGGVHVYFAGTDQGNHVRKDLKVDFRSLGGYVLAPPSHTEKGMYTLDWEDARSGVTFDWSVIEDMFPRARTISEVDKAHKARANAMYDPARLVLWLEKRQPGERNASLHWALHRVCERGDFEWVPHLMNASLDSGHSEHSVASTTESVLSNYSPDGKGK